MKDPNKLLFRVAPSRSLTPALTAIGVAWALTLAIHLVYLIRDFLWMIHDGFGDLGEAFGYFGESGILEPLLFFIGAGALLVLVLPIVPESKLGLVMLRVAAASLGGIVVLTVKGLIEAIVDVARFGFEFGYFVNDWIGWPIVRGFDLAVLLVVGAVVAWLLATRRAAAPVASTPPATPDAPSSGAV